MGAKNVKSVDTKALMSSKGQIVIPVEIRELMGVGTGTEFQMSYKDGKIELIPAKTVIQEIFGVLKNKNSKPIR